MKPPFVNREEAGRALGDSVRALNLAPPFVVLALPRGGAPIGAAVARARAELPEITRRREAYLGGREPLDVAGCTAIVVDDGIATGTTMRAALKALRRRRPARLVLAVPVAPREALESLRAEVDDVICLARPDPFDAVGNHYVDFHQVSDAEVLASLASGQVAPLPAGSDSVRAASAPKEPKPESGRSNWCSKP